METCKKLFSCWSSWSSSTKLLLIMVVLILVSGLVCVVSPRNSGWVSLSYHPGLWTSGIPASTSVTATAASTGSISVMKATGSSEKERERHLGYHSVVMGVHHIEEEEQEEKALSEASSTFNRSSPPFANETIQPRLPINQSNHNLQPTNSTSEILQLIMDKQGGFNSSINASSGSEVQTRRVKRDYSILDKLEAGLSSARAAIREAARYGNRTVAPGYVPFGPIYRNAPAFHRSYLEMEKKFKIFVYEEGEPPIFHNGPCKSIYSMEGNFIHMMEIDRRFRTQNPSSAHVYLLPFSVVMMVRFVYVRDSHDFHPIRKTVIDYLNVISGKYPYWNRSLGADHFMVSCHDWGPEASRSVPYLYKNSIRVLCNANTSEGFNPSKDVSFPEINLMTGGMDGIFGGPSPSRRPILAFFAGGLHGPIRPLLLEHWKDKDEDMQVHQYLPKGVSYHDMMRKSRFCICPSGYEVASPRVVEAIYTGCIPVLISDHYVPPFSDVLNWKSFSVEVPVREIPNLKRILMSISSRQYIRMQRRVLQVRRHFEVHSPPKRFDVFHMIIHSIWLRRLNVHLHDY